MVGLLVAIALTQSDIFQKVVPVPTGQNGYEEYVQAASLLQSPEAKALLDGPLRPNETPTSPLRSQLAGKSRLDVERLLWARYGRAMDLVERGNAKPVFSPRDRIGPSTLFPELAGFKQIGRLGTAGAHVLFADGSPRAATRCLLTVLDMAGKIDDQILISHLVGIAIIAMVGASIDENMDRLSEADWLAVGKATTARLARPSTMPRVLNGELNAVEATLDSLADRLSSPDRSTKSASSDDPDEQIERLTKGYSREQWSALKSAVLTAVRFQYAQIVATLNGPERNWQGVPIVTNDPVVQAVSDAMTPAYSQTLVAEAKCNTQMRLLRLHAAIQLYRWRTGRLPEKLAQVAESIQDPLAGDDFVYEPAARGQYALYSRGNSDTGRIDLKYVPAKGGMDEDMSRVP